MAVFVELAERLRFMFWVFITGSGSLWIVFELLLRWGTGREEERDQVITFIRSATMCVRLGWKYRELCRLQ